MPHVSATRDVPEHLVPSVPRVLCVDPDARVTGGLTGLLEREGFHVDVEHDGRRALRLALAGGYDAIITETQLPRVGGLAIVTALRQEGVTTPVVLLTASPSVDAAIEATRLDALYLVKARATLSQIVSALRSAPVRRAAAPLPLFAEHETVDLDRGSRGRAELARALHDAALTFTQFLSAAAGLRAALGASTVAVAPGQASWQRVHPLAREAVLRIEQADARWSALNEVTLATELSIRTAAVCRLLHHELGLGFLECRRAVVMRRAVRTLTASREQVAQVAYGLGYEHASSFNRDFRRFLHTSPTGFRRLIRDETDKE